MTFLPIIEVFRQPYCVNNFSYNDWQKLLEQSYANKMTARVKNWLKINGLSNAVPAKIQWHFDAAWNYYLAQKSDVIKECELIHSSLGMNPNPVVFLKGAAYMLSQSLVSEGRLFGDIDILTAKSTLHQTEKFLLWSGWRHSEKSDYDQSYYREWMHELPPLVHGVRGTTLDVHHNILPPISGRSPEISEFPIKVHKLKEKEFVTFSAPAMTLHSIVHLFFEEDFSKGFRDLNDLHLLFFEYGQTQAFWEDLFSLADKHNFKSELALACHFTKVMFSTSIPDFVFKRLADVLPSRIERYFFLKLLAPANSGGKHSLPLFFGLLRGHLRKMPLPILLKHTVHKLLFVLRGLFTNSSSGPG